jgi:ABC-2 type transport system permease protein
MRETWQLTRYMLRLRRRSLVAWTATVTGYTMMMVLVYTSIGDINFNELLESYPEEVKAFFGGSFDFSTAIGYLRVELFSFVVPLSLAFLPVTIASGAIAAAEDQGHLDVLLGAPVPRRALVLGAYLTGALALAAVLAVTAVTNVAFAAIIGIDLSFAELAEACVAVLPLTLVFGAVAVLTAAVSPHRGRTIAIASGLLIAMYLVNGLAPMVDLLDKVNNVSVFKYYTPWYQEGINWPEWLAMTALSAAIALAAIPIYNRRDVH